MIYLLDANVLITAKNNYYGFEIVPQFWDWLISMGNAGHIKIAPEIYAEITAGTDDLADWAKTEDAKAALLLDATVEPAEVQAVMDLYGANLEENEIEQIGKDPFLIAYAAKDTVEHIVVTTETSKPTAQRANRRVPDVCDEAGVVWIDTFALVKKLGFNAKSAN